ncbi:MAG: hypothetical protein KAI17_27140 [Thiotrichaceae bacterium]|nr:hypothetical protein [Thiotrichaceae bacterium]
MEKDMIKKNIFRLNTIVLILIVLWANLLLSSSGRADDSLFENEQLLDIKALKNAGKITSLEQILAKLSMFKIHRILEIEFKQNSSQHDKHPFVYEIEYINDEGFVLEIEVNALSAEVLSLEQGD